MNDANPQMPEANKCPQCGTLLQKSALSGLCPACLLKEGAAGDTATGGRFLFFEPPPVAELAAKFPQLDILELIGKGGMGAVYKARQKELDRIVALKILPPGIGEEAGFAERFSREAKALAKLNHPGIVTIHDFGRTDGLYYFVMEFVDGVNLRQLLQRSRISPREALAIVPQICDALQFAHDHGIVHRDIKPENILMDRRGRVKVADFGLAKLVGMANEIFSEQSSSSSSLTDAGKVMGTPNYMSPEQIENPGEVDHRADIYALGVVFYQMLTGELPGKQLQPPSSKVQIDVRLDEIVLRALEKKPELRYQQVNEVKTCVENITGSAGVPSAESGVAPDSRKTNLEERAVGATPTAARETRTLPATPPRFSRMAIVGATWAAFFGLMLLLMFMPWTGQITQYRGSTWWREFCTFLFAHGLPMFNPNSPTWGMFTLLPLGLAAPFVTTILGWIAVSQIRRSAGKIYGFGLAVFDGLLFPLLLLDGLLCGFFIKMGKLLADFYANLAQANNPQVHPRFLTRTANHLAEHPFEIPIIIAIAISIIVNLFIVRRVWRAVNKPHNETRKSGEAPVARRKFIPAVIVVVGVSMSIGIIGMTAALNYWRTKDKTLFGPEKEMIINIGDGKNSFFRLGSEDFVDGPKDFDPASSEEADTQKLWKWLTAHGVDLLVQRKDGKPILAMSDMLVAVIEDKDFDRIRTAEQLKKNALFGRVMDAQFRPAVSSLTRGAFGGIVTVAFQTRYETVGMLQVMGVVNDPPGVKIRYKLLQEADVKVPAPLSPVPTEIDFKFLKTEV
ncbi:MAG: serine/threonine-protein kinase, partial [Verrucomicrobiota bacterium]